MEPIDPAPRHGRRRRLAPPLLTEQDRQLLEFAAQHRFLHRGHVEACLGVSGSGASRRLHALTNIGALRPESPFFSKQPECYRITRPGLRVLASELPAPRLDLGNFWHDVGMAWLWLGARQGTFGPMRQVLSERGMRSRDGSARAIDEPPLGVKLGGYGPGGRERVHYPDLVMVDAGGRRIAVELELSGKSAARRERIFAGYAADPRFDGVLYLVEKDSVGRAIQASARKFGIERRVLVQRVELTGVSQTASRSRAATGDRVAASAASRQRRDVARGARVPTATRTARPGDLGR